MANFTESGFILPTKKKTNKQKNTTFLSSIVNKVGDDYLCTQFVYSLNKSSLPYFTDIFRNIT